MQQSAAPGSGVWSRISVVVITLNEERNLPRCLDSVPSAGEILVVDSGSTDGTRGVAESYGARWLERRWQGFAPQRIFGEAHASGEYVLFLDADEWLTPELYQEVAQILAEEGEAGKGCAEGARHVESGKKALLLSFHRRSEFLGREILHGDWQNDRVARLCPRGRGVWRGLEPHPWLTSAADAELKELRCEAALKHRPYRDLAVFRAKIESYAMTGAEAILEKQGVLKAGGRSFFWPLEAGFRAGWRWARGYVLRGGFLDGKAGWHIAVQNARMVWLKYFFLSRLARKREQGDTCRDR